MWHYKMLGVIFSSSFVSGCSTGIEIELGGERRVSEHSSAAMFCVLGLQVFKHQAKQWLNEWLHPSRGFNR